MILHHLGRIVDMHGVVAYFTWAMEVRNHSGRFTIDENGLDNRII